MDKHTIAFYALFALILIILATILFRSCSEDPTLFLNKALRNLDSAQHRLDTALVKIDDSKRVIDSMRANLANFQTQVGNIRSGVDQLKVSSTVSRSLFTTSLESLKKRDQELLKQLNVNRDTLPEIKIISR